MYVCMCKIAKRHPPSSFDPPNRLSIYLRENFYYHVRYMTYTNEYIATVSQNFAGVSPQNGTGTSD